MKTEKQLESKICEYKSRGPCFQIWKEVNWVNGYEKIKSGKCVYYFRAEGLFVTRIIVLLFFFVGSHLCVLLCWLHFFYSIFDEYFFPTLSFPASHKILFLLFSYEIPLNTLLPYLSFHCYNACNQWKRTEGVSPYLFFFFLFLRALKQDLVLIVCKLKGFLGMYS